MEFSMKGGMESRVHLLKVIEDVSQPYVLQVHTLISITNQSPSIMMPWRRSADKKIIYKAFCGQLQGHGWVWLMMGANRGRRQAMLPTHFVSSTNYCHRLGWVLSKHAIVLAMADTIIPTQPKDWLVPSDCLGACSVFWKLPHRTYSWEHWNETKMGRRITLGVVRFNPI